MTTVADRHWQSIYRRRREAGQQIGEALSATNARLRLQRHDWKPLLRNVGSRDLFDILLDADFWEDQKSQVLAVMEPLFREIFDDGKQYATTFNVPGYQSPRANRGLTRFFRRRDMLDPDPDVWDDIASGIFRDYTDDWWLQLQKTTQDRLRDVLMRAYDEGATLDAIVEELEPLFGPERARRVGVTESTRLFGRGAQATYMASGLESWTWLDVGDSRVCSTCQALNGQVFPISMMFDPAHVSCLADPLTMIGGASVQALSRRWYEGEALVLRTASSDELTVTPNHPILTPFGWLSAGELREGQDVVCQVGEREASAIDPHDVEMPTRLEDIVRALLELGETSRLRVPATAEQFHGDGQVGQGEVEIVWADRLLQDVGNTPFIEPIGERSLIHRLPHEPALSFNRPPHPLFDGRTAPGGSLMSLRYLPVPHVCVHAGPLQPLGVRRTPWPDIGFEQSAANRDARDSVGDGEGILGLAGYVPPNDFGIGQTLPAWAQPVSLTEVRQIRIASHVFNLQTDRGWYTANGIVTHNCRCYPQPGGDLG